MTTQCWICGRVYPCAVGEWSGSTAYTAAHVHDGRPCAERFYYYYTDEDQAANLEALLDEIESWPT